MSRATQKFSLPDDYLKTALFGLRQKRAEEKSGVVLSLTQAGLAKRFVLMAGGVV